MLRERHKNDLLVRKSADKGSWLVVVTTTRHTPHTCHSHMFKCAGNPRRDCFVSPLVYTLNVRCAGTVTAWAARQCVASRGGGEADDGENGAGEICCAVASRGKL